MRPFLAMLLLAAIGSPTGAMTLGVNTHFDQNWPIAAMDRAQQAHAQGLRDAIGWGKVEQSPGRYEFTQANSGFAGLACQRGLPLLLTLTPRNKIYDAGETVFSEEGRRAFGAFAAAVADRFPCLAAVEIGNEINGHSLSGRMTRDMPQSYVAIVATVRAALKPRHPRVALLGGSTLSVATGFQARLFGAGLLPLVDGVAIHPYLATPEQLPLHLARLDAAMKAAGATRPVWVSEFGYAYPTPDDAPPHALKMITLLSAGHVARADWYALLDEKFYPNMGLFAGTAPKPALDTFATAVTRLLPQGDAVRIEQGDPLTQIYRFGAGLYVAWGSNRPIRWAGQARAWDARGTPIALPDRLGDAPVIVDASQGFALGAPTVLADSQLDFGGASWRYEMVAGNSAVTPLDWIDWTWTPYIGIAKAPNFRAMPNAVSLAGGASDPRQLIERYAGRGSGRHWISACFETAPVKAAQIEIIAGGRTLYAGQVDGTVRTAPLEIAGEAPAFEVHYRSNATGPLVVRRRIRLLASADPAPALCSGPPENQAQVGG